MLFKRSAKVVLAIITTVCISSCGGESPGGGTSEFKTVSISSAAKSVSLDSDILKGNTCTNGVSAGGTVIADSVDFTFTSKVYTGVTTGLPVAIDSYTIEYVANPSASTSTPVPVVASVSGSILGQTISPGGSLTVPVNVVTIPIKESIAISRCVGPLYSYYALVRFSAVEVGTGTRSTIGPISLNINIADFGN
jgi:hypothetical protein